MLRSLSFFPIERTYFDWRARAIIFVFGAYAWLFSGVRVNVRRLLCFSRSVSFFDSDRCPAEVYRSKSVKFEKCTT